MYEAGRNEIIYGSGFLRDAKRLPREVQNKLALLLGQLKEDAFASALHTKPLGTPLRGKYAFRVTRDWRVVFEFSGSHTIVLLVADHRSRIYKRASRL